MRIFIYFVVYKRFPNNDNISSYANASIQYIFHSPILRRALFRLEDTNIMKKLIDSYTSNNKDLNIFTARTLAGNDLKKKLRIS